ncbi:MAG: L-aspartate oxidase [Planctomycetota bacterium]
MDELFDQRRYLIPFRSSLLPQIFTHTLVIGGGVAGLRAALAAAEHGDVILLSKGPFGETNTAWAQGGVAAVLGGGEAVGDSVADHERDTHEAGAGLCDDEAVRVVVGDGPGRVEELLNWGMAVDRDASGEPARGREGGHSAHRVYHSGGDATGREIERVLVERVRAHAGIRIFESCFALDLITPSEVEGAAVLGAITHHTKHGLQMVWARSTVLASGGAGRVYRETTNPRVATADGLAMAYRAGAVVRDMAFVQFHPTALYLPGAPRALISEAVRGEGALLLDQSGRRFMQDEHELAELAPRDVVSRAIVRAVAASGGGRGGHVWLDCRGVEGMSDRFPGITRMLSGFGLDPSRDLIPVHPAAHYTIGGVRTDLDGRTGVPGLYAAGEVSCSGLHGANRLASNSLLEGLVLGARAGGAAGVEGAGRPPAAPLSIVSDIRPSEHGELDLGDVKSSLRSAMWRNVGVVRTGAKLRDARDMLGFWARYTLDKIFDGPEGWEVQNMLLVGALIAESALWREESRGCHTREDFAEASDALRAHDAWRRGDAAAPVIEPLSPSVDGAVGHGAPVA